jgi:hypothetical protein
MARVCFSVPMPSSILQATWRSKTNLAQINIKGRSDVENKDGQKF